MYKNTDYQVFYDHDHFANDFTDASGRKFKHLLIKAVNKTTGEKGISAGYNFYPDTKQLYNQYIFINKGHDKNLIDHAHNAAKIFTGAQELTEDRDF